jgi:hypothetical protein
MSTNYEIWKAHTENGWTVEQTAAHFGIDVDAVLRVALSAYVLAQRGRRCFA